MAYTERTKNNVIREYNRKILTVREICTKYSITMPTLYRWLGRHGIQLKKTGEVKIKRPYKELLKENLLLKEQMELYQTSKCTPQSPDEDKIKAIDELSDRYPIKTLCKIFCLDRNKYYRNKQPRKTVYELRNEELLPKVVKIFNENNATYGAKRICAKLREEGFITSQRKVSALMKEADIHVETGKKKRDAAKESGHIEYLIEKYAIQTPNIIWLSDVTEFEVCGIKFYICFIEDVFSRYIVSYGVSSKNNIELLMYTFDKALRENGNPTPTIFHSDNGAIYKSHAFRGYLKANGMKQTFSRVARPTDNSAMESFIGTVKKEGLYRHSFTNPEDFLEFLEQYISYYNNARIHSSLQYRTPKSIYSQKISNDANIKIENKNSKIRQVKIPTLCLHLPIKAAEQNDEQESKSTTQPPRIKYNKLVKKGDILKLTNNTKRNSRLYKPTK